MTLKWNGLVASLSVGTEVIFRHAEGMLVDFAILPNNQYAVCTRSGNVLIVKQGDIIKELDPSAYFQPLDYYMMGKVFTVLHERWLIYPSQGDRSQIVLVDLLADSYSTQIIKTPAVNIFHIVQTDPSTDILALSSETSEKLVFFHVLLRQTHDVVTLDSGYSYRTLASNKHGYLAVAGVRKTASTTENLLYLLDPHKNILGKTVVTLEGYHLGRYFHKLQLSDSDEMTLPAVFAITHHYDAAGLYTFTADDSNADSSTLTPLQDPVPLADSWVWDLHVHRSILVVATSHNSVIKLSLALTKPN